PIGAREEGVGHAPGAEGKPAGGQGQVLVADVELELALADVEPLVLIAVDVPGGADARRRLDIDQGVLAGSVVCADLDRYEGAVEPEVLAFLLIQRIAESRPVGRGDGGHGLSFLAAEGRIDKWVRTTCR